MSEVVFLLEEGSMEVLLVRYYPGLLQDDPTG